MTVKAILSDKGYQVQTIPPAATLEEAARLLDARRIGALVVTDADGRVAGVLSERDIVRSIAQHGANALSLSVSDTMTRRVATCEESDTVGDLMEQMTNGRFRHVPVLDGNEQLCGMISIGDVVKTRIAETVNEAAALRDYISATA